MQIWSAERQAQQSELVKLGKSKDETASLVKFGSLGVA
jgi:hypothetical protein